MISLASTRTRCVVNLLSSTAETNIQPSADSTFQSACEPCREGRYRICKPLVKIAIYILRSLQRWQRCCLLLAPSYPSHLEMPSYKQLQPHSTWTRQSHRQWLSVGKARKREKATTIFTSSTMNGVTFSTHGTPPIWELWSTARRCRISFRPKLYDESTIHKDHCCCAPLIRSTAFAAFPVAVGFRWGFDPFKFRQMPPPVSQVGSSTIMEIILLCYPTRLYAYGSQYWIENSLNQTEYMASVIDFSNGVWCVEWPHYIQAKFLLIITMYMALHYSATITGELCFQLFRYRIFPSYQ
jgi:hypothetical protein